MDIQTLLMLSCTVFGASLLQAAAGIGYGVIAGPILLIVLNGSEAFEISTLHNLIIAIVLISSRPQYGKYQPARLSDCRRFTWNIDRFSF